MRSRFKYMLLASVAVLAPLLGQAAVADDTGHFMPGASGTQFMLYVSQPLGGHVRRAPQFGLRLERMQPVAAVAGAPFALHLRHHLLIDLQFATDHAPRIQFGERYRLGYRLGAFAFEDPEARARSR
jgi:hypothetical protein